MRRSQLWMLSFRAFFVGSKWCGTIQERCFSTACGCQSGKKAGASQPAVYISSMRVMLACPMVTVVMIAPPSLPSLWIVVANFGCWLAIEGEHRRHSPPWLHEDFRMPLRRGQRFKCTFNFGESDMASDHRRGVN